MNYLSEDIAWEIKKLHGTPTYVYDEASLEDAARQALAFLASDKITVRFAMKACPTRAILQIFNRCGLHIDASSGFEAWRAMAAGIPAEKIQLTAQELPQDLGELVRAGVLFNATSINQLLAYGRLLPNSDISIRINPGLGSGHNNRTNVGGPSSSFGIWHEKLDLIEQVRKDFGLNITGLHTHIGSGGDPEVWQQCARMSLEIVSKFPSVNRLSLGGGFKVGRMPDEQSADLQNVGEALAKDFKDFARNHGRQLRLEIEPGTFLVARAGCILASVIDVVNTGPQGYRFIKLDTGMTENLRPSLYGAQHPLRLITKHGGCEKDYVVVGHCCESGDILTPQPQDPEAIATRLLPETNIGDLMVVGAAGAYCSGMPAKNYNSFPEAAEVLLTKKGELRLIRERQSLEQIVANEIGLPNIR